jgi:sortase A
MTLHVQSFRREGTLRKVPHLARTPMTWTALLLIGVTALLRTKSKRPAPSVPDAIAPYGLTHPEPRPVEEPEPAKPKRPRGSRLGKILIALGVVLIAYSGAVIFWGDPATGLYARWKQHQLASALDKEYVAYAAALTPVAEERPPAANQQEIAEYERERIEAAANRLQGKLKMGHALGRIKIPRIGLNAVFVQGTRWGPDLSQGPGHYAQTSLPGVGRTMAIAAHRTTFGAWFRHIDSLKTSDRVSLRLPYATFYYRVFRHKIVNSGDWSIIRDRGFDTLVLSACHPLYSASHRWIVFAALVRVDPVKGTPYLVNRRNDVRPLGS